MESVIVDYMLKSSDESVDKAIMAEENVHSDVIKIIKFMICNN